jgi:hypothetical protein
MRTLIVFKGKFPLNSEWIVLLTGYRGNSSEKENILWKEEFFLGKRKNLQEFIALKEE